MTAADLAAARAEALFFAPICRNDPLDKTTATALIAAQIRAHGGCRQCAAHLAYEYGRHPYETADRMAWAWDTVNNLYNQTNGYYR